MFDLPDPTRPLRIGTRGSPLALAQAHETRTRLSQAFKLPDNAFEIIIITTTGDRITDRSLKDLGGKGLFTREIEEDLLANQIDIAVHSMKDMPVAQPDGLMLDCYLPREDPRDALVSENDVTSIAMLQKGAVVGTSSLRRRAQVLNRRPDLKVVEFRGNVGTRIDKLRDKVADCTFLAVAGLNRLGKSKIMSAAIDPDEMLPAVAQGAIGIERRADDDRIAQLLSAIHDTDTGHRLAAERAFLAALDGSCETPIAGLAELSGNTVRLRGEVLRPDGSESISDAIEGPISNASELGRALGERMLDAAGPGFFDFKS